MFLQAEPPPETLQQRRERVRAEQEIKLSAVARSRAVLEEGMIQHLMASTGLPPELAAIIATCWNDSPGLVVVTLINRFKTFEDGTGHLEPPWRKVLRPRRADLRALLDHASRDTCLKFEYHVRYINGVSMSMSPLVRDGPSLTLRVAEQAGVKTVNDLLNFARPPGASSPSCGNCCSLEAATCQDPCVYSLSPTLRTLKDEVIGTIDLEAQLHRGMVSSDSAMVCVCVCE
jgi:hypothetical protein